MRRSPSTGPDLAIARARISIGRRRPTPPSCLLFWLSVSPRPHVVIAAGHAATNALQHAAHVNHAQASRAPARLVLIEPTWRGPLPTMMGGQRPFFARLCRLVDLPLVGPLIYRANVNRLMIRHMGAGHVYSDAAFLQGERLREKLAVIRAPGARFRVGPVRDRRSRSAREPRRIPRPRSPGERSHPAGLWSRDAAEVARGDGGLRGAAPRSQRDPAPRQACRARGVSRCDRARPSLRFCARTHAALLRPDGVASLFSLRYEEMC